MKKYLLEYKIYDNNYDKTKNYVKLLNVNKCYKK